MKLNKMISLSMSCILSMSMMVGCGKNNTIETSETVTIEENNDKEIIKQDMKIASDGLSDIYNIQNELWNNKDNKEILREYEQTFYNMRMKEFRINGHHPDTWKLYHILGDICMYGELSSLHLIEDDIEAYTESNKKMVELENEFNEKYEELINKLED